MPEQVVYRIVIDDAPALAAVGRITSRSRAAIAELERLASKPRRSQSDLESFATTAGTVRADLKAQRSVAAARGDTKTMAAADAALRDLTRRIDEVFPRGSLDSKNFRPLIQRAQRAAERAINQLGQNYQLAAAAMGDAARAAEEVTKDSKKAAKDSKKAAAATARKAKAAESDAQASEQQAAEEKKAAEDKKATRASQRAAKKRQQKADEDAAKAAEDAAREAKVSQASASSGATRRRQKADEDLAKTLEQRNAQEKTILGRLKTADRSKLSSSTQSDLDKVIKSLETGGGARFTAGQQRAVKKVLDESAVAEVEAALRGRPASTQGTTVRRLDEARASGIGVGGVPLTAKQLDNLDTAITTLQKGTSRGFTSKEASAIEAAIGDKGLIEAAKELQAANKAESSAARRRASSEVTLAELNEQEAVKKKARKKAEPQAVIAPSSTDILTPEERRALAGRLSRDYVGPRGLGFDPADQARFDAIKKASKATLTSTFTSPSAGLGFTTQDFEGLTKDKILKLIRQRLLGANAISDAIAEAQSGAAGFIPGPGFGYKGFSGLGRTTTAPFEGLVVRAPQAKGEQFSLYQPYRDDQGRPDLRQIIGTKGPIQASSVAKLSEEYQKALDAGERIGTISANEARAVRQLNERVSRRANRYLQTRKDVENALSSGEIDPEFAASRLFEINKRMSEDRLRAQAAASRVGAYQPDPKERERQERGLRFGRLLGLANEGVDPRTDAEFLNLRRQTQKRVLDRYEAITTGRLVRQAGELVPASSLSPTIDPAIARAGALRRSGLTPSASGLGVSGGEAAAFERLFKEGQLRFDKNNQLLLPSTVTDLPFKDLRARAADFGVSGRSRSDVVTRLTERYREIYAKFDQFAADFEAKTFSGKQGITGSDFFRRRNEGQLAGIRDRTKNLPFARGFVASASTALSPEGFNARFLTSLTQMLGGTSPALSNVGAARLFTEMSYLTGAGGYAKAPAVPRVRPATDPDAGAAQLSPEYLRRIEAERRAADGRRLANRRLATARLMGGNLEAGYAGILKAQYETAAADDATVRSKARKEFGYRGKDPRKRIQDYLAEERAKIEKEIDDFQKEIGRFVSKPQDRVYRGPPRWTGRTQTYGLTTPNDFRPGSVGLYGNKFDYGAGRLVSAPQARRSEAETREERYASAQEERRRLSLERALRIQYVEQQLNEINQKRLAAAESRRSIADNVARMEQQLKREEVRLLESKKAELVARAGELGIPVGAKDTKAVIARKILNAPATRAAAIEGFITDEARGRLPALSPADVAAGKKFDPARLEAERKVVREEIRAAGSLEAYIKARVQSTEAAAVAARAESEGAKAQAQSTSADVKNAQAVQQNTEAVQADTSEKKRKKKKKSKKDSGEVDPEYIESSDAMIKAQNAKAVAATFVAEKLVEEASSAILATKAQLRKAAAANAVAAVLEGQISALTASAAASAKTTGTGSILDDSVGSQKVRNLRQKRGRRAEAGERVDKDTIDRLLAAEELRLANDSTKPRGRKNIAARQEQALQDELDRIMQQRIETEARLNALKSRTAPDIAAQARRENELKAIQTRDDLNLLRQKTVPVLGGQSLLDLEAEKVRIQSQQNVALQRLTAIYLARDKIATQILTLEAESRAYAQLGFNGQRRLAEAQARSKVDAAEQAARAAVALNDPVLRNQYVEQQGIRAAADAETKAAVDAETARRRAQLLQDPGYRRTLESGAEDSARIALIEQEIALRAKTNVALALTDSQVQESALLSVQQAGIKRRQLLAEKRLEVNNEAAARESAEIAVLNAQIAQQQRRELRRQMRHAEGLPFSQRFGLRGYSGVGGSGFGSGGGGTFLGSLGTTARYGASSFLLFGALGGLSVAIKEAEELEKTLNQVRSQFLAIYEAQGQGGAEEAFTQFRQNILDVAKLTGQSADEVANLAFQFQGAFGGNTVKTIAETQAAIEAVKVTGLSLKETIDAFTALTQSYRDTGISIFDVSDKALGLQERFGVLAKETISFAADLAPVGEASGFTVQQLEALGATAQRFSGKSGSSLAEAFGRIIPQVQDNALNFIQLFQQLAQSSPQFEQALPDITQALGSGDIQKFFEILIPLYQQLSAGQRTYILDLIGSRRETQSLVGVLENGQELLNEWNGGFSDAGKTTERFSQLQETLSQKMARFGEQMRQIGVDIFEGGLGDALKALVDVVSALASVLGTVLTPLAGIVGAFDGFAVKALAAVAAVRLLGPILGRLNATSGGMSILGTLGARYRGAAPQPGVGPFGGNVNYAALNASAGGPAAPTGLRGVFSGAGGATLAALGGWGGVASIGALIGLQLVSGFRDGAREEMRKSAEAVYQPLAEAREAAVAEGRDFSAREFLGNDKYQELIDTATGARARREGARVDQSNAWETISEFPQTFTNDLDLSGGSPDYLRVSDKEAEEMKAARQALVEAEGERFRQMMISLSDYSANQVREEAGRSRLLAGELLLSTADTLTKDGATLIVGDTGSSNPSDVIAGLKADAVARGEELDLTQISGQIELGGENIKFNQQDIQEIMSSMDAGEALTERQTKIFTALLEQLDEENLKNLPVEARDALTRARNILQTDPAIADVKLKLQDYGTAYDKGFIGTGQDRTAFSTGEYLNKLQEQKRELERYLSNGTPNKKIEEELKRINETIEKVTIDAVKGQVQAITKGLELSGQNTDAVIPILLARFKDPLTNKQERGDLMEQYFSLQQQTLNRMIDDADSTSEALAIANNGLAIDPAVRVEFLRQQLTYYNTAYQQWLAGMGLSAQATEDVTNAVSERMIETGESLEEATKAVLQSQYNLLTRQLAWAVEFFGTNSAEANKIRDTQQELFQRLSALNNGEGLPENITEPQNPSVIRPEDTQRKRMEEERQREQLDIQKSRIDLQKAYAGSNQIYLAQLDKQAAELDLAYARANGDTAGANRALAAIAEADRRIGEAGINIQKAKVSYYKTLAGQNGVLQAQYDRQIAELDLQLARSTGDESGIYAALAAIEQSFITEANENDNFLKARIELQKARNGGDELANAQLDQQLADIDLRIAQRSGDVAGEAAATARRIEADRAVQNAMIAMREAQLSIVLAQANALDDTVKAAEVGVEQARLALDRARISGDPNAIREAEAQIITAQDQLHDTQLQENIDAQQFLLDMGQISRGQFIEFLKSLMGMAGNSEKDVQNIRRQIKQLQGELGADLQYNLPTTLGLAGLYEARRVNQSNRSYAGVMGAGYNDNRNVQVNITVNNSADASQVVSIVENALGTPIQGTVPRRY